MQDLRQWVEEDSSRACLKVGVQAAALPGQEALFDPSGKRPGSFMVRCIVGLKLESPVASWELSQKPTFALSTALEDLSEPLGEISTTADSNFKVVIASGFPFFSVERNCDC